MQGYEVRSKFTNKWVHKTAQMFLLTSLIMYGQDL